MQIEEPDSDTSMSTLTMPECDKGKKWHWPPESKTALESEVPQVWHPRTYSCSLSHREKFSTSQAMSTSWRRRKRLDLASSRSASLKASSRSYKPKKFDHVMPKRLSLSTESLPPELEAIAEEIETPSSSTSMEETFKMIRQRNKFNKIRAYKEKVASLKAIVGRLQKICLEKPEMLPEEMSEETVKLFKSLQL